MMNTTRILYSQTRQPRTQCCCAARGVTVTVPRLLVEMLRQNYPGETQVVSWHVRSEAPFQYICYYTCMKVLALWLELNLDFSSSQYG